MIWVQILASTTLVLIPAYIVRCRFFDFCNNLSPIPLTLLEVSIILTVLAWVLWRLSLLKKKKTGLLEPFQDLSRPVIVVVGIFLLSGLISVFVSPDFRAAAGIFKAYFVEAAVFGFIVFDLSSKKGSIRWMVTPFVLSGLWVAVFALYQQVTGQFVPHHEELRSRVSSIYSTSNAVGLYLGPLLFFTLGFILDQSKKIRETNNKSIIYYLLAAFVFLLTIFFSGSRGALVAVLAGLGFLGIYRFYLNSNSSLQKIMRKAFVLAVIAFILGNTILILNRPGLTSFFGNQKYFDTLTSRFCLWEKSQQILVENPILGSGLSNFAPTSKNYPVCEAGVSIYPHNIFLNFWLETGVAGLLSFLSVVFLIWQGLFKSKNLAAGGIMAALVYLFVHGIVDVPYFKNDLSTEFWVMAAISFWLIKVKKPTSARL